MISTPLAMQKPARYALLLTACVAATSPAQDESAEDLVQRFLWSSDAAAELAAETEIRARYGDDAGAISAQAFRNFETLVERGPAVATPATSPSLPGLVAMSVPLPGSIQMPVFVQLPSGYDPTQSWPVMLAMHGGPVGDPTDAIRGAGRMIEVWKPSAEEAGWVIVSPAMVHVVARAPRTEQRLPYEILTTGQMEALLRSVAERIHIDPNRIVSTGISLGSNFSIAYAAARPDRFAAIVPVSTEGESREALLRNLQHVPVFTLEGSRDPNIRSIDGPRAMAKILDRLGYDHRYQELGERGHESFDEYYPEVLRWLEARPRDPHPRAIQRAPHSGIAPLSRRIYWLETDTQQALVEARVTARNRIEIEVRWAREIELFLNDDLVDLDGPLQILVNGEKVLDGELERSLPFALSDVRARNDWGRVYAASVTVPVPTTQSSIERGRALSRSMQPQQAPGRLSFWEMYAIRSLEERFPSLGFSAVEASPKPSDLEGETAAMKVTEVAAGSAFARAGLRVGDVLLEVGDEPFFTGRELSVLYERLVRELTTEPRAYPLRIRRDGEELTLSANLELGPYRAR